MSKLSVIIHRASTASLKRFRNNINVVHKESGKSKLSLFSDMVYCVFRYGIGYLDYNIFGFAFIGKDKRKTYVTMKENIELVRRLNKREAYEILDNKLLFNQTFKDFIKRDFVDLRDGFDGFEAFLAGKDTFFAKQLDSFGGLGVRKVRLAQHPDRKKLYEELMQAEMFLAEGEIVQHPEMCRPCPQALNTMRITTIVNDKHQAKVLYVIFRVGNGKSDVDNATSGGMYTMPDETGTVRYPFFCDKTAETYTVHPNNGFPFKGFQIPYYKEALELCQQAAFVVPELRYIGWDVGISSDGPVLVEGNNLPGYDMPQNHLFNPSGIGMKAVYEAAIQGT